jgi:hypothetical protein
MPPKGPKGPGKDPPPGGAPTRPPSQRNHTSRNAGVNQISSAAPQLPQQNDTTRNAVVNKNPSAAPQLPQNSLRNAASDTKGKAVDRFLQLLRQLRQDLAFRNKLLAMTEV